MKKILLAVLPCLLTMTSLSFADTSERAKATSEQVSGSVKSTAGDVLGSDKMKTEGKSTKLKGDLRSTKEDIKDKITGE